MFETAKIDWPITYDPPIGMHLHGLISTIHGLKTIALRLVAKIPVPEIIFLDAWEVHQHSHTIIQLVYIPWYLLATIPIEHQQKPW